MGNNLVGAGLQHDGEALGLMSEKALEQTPTIYRGARCGSKGAKGAMPKLAAPPHPLLAVHRVRWNPNGGSSRAWLAHGGASGFLRFQHIPVGDPDYS